MESLGRRGSFSFRPYVCVNMWLCKYLVTCVCVCKCVCVCVFVLVLYNHCEAITSESSTIIIVCAGPQALCSHMNVQQRGMWHPSRGGAFTVTVCEGVSKPRACESGRGINSRQHQRQQPTAQALACAERPQSHCQQPSQRAAASQTTARPERRWSARQ